MVDYESRKHTASCPHCTLVFFNEGFASAESQLAQHISLNHSVKPKSPHTTLSDNTPADDRRELAIKMLNNWFALETKARSPYAYRQNRELARLEADNARYEILELMGAD